MTQEAFAQDNGQQNQQNVQPMPPLMIATAYGKKAAQKTGTFLYYAAAAGVGMWGLNLVQNWFANRSAASVDG